MHISLRKLMIKYNIVLAPLTLASLLMVYAGLKIHSKPLLVTGMVLTIMSPFVAYIVTVKLLLSRKWRH